MCCRSFDGAYVMDSKKPASLRLDFGGSDGSAFGKVFPPCPPAPSSPLLPAQVWRVRSRMHVGPKQPRKRLLLQTAPKQLSGNSGLLRLAASPFWCPASNRGPKHPQLFGRPKVASSQCGCFFRSLTTRQPQCSTAIYQHVLCCACCACCHEMSLGVCEPYRQPSIGCCQSCDGVLVQQALHE